MAFKYVHALISQMCECVTENRKRNSAHVIKDLEMRRSFLNYPSGLSVIIRVLIRRKS